MSEGFNAVGISQGGLLLRFALTLSHLSHWSPGVSRGLAERCPVPMKTLITFGSPHQGVFGVPHCVDTTNSYLLCEIVRQLISLGGYISSSNDLSMFIQAPTSPGFRIWSPQLSTGMTPSMGQLTPRVRETCYPQIIHMLCQQLFCRFSLPGSHQQWGGGQEPRI